MIYQLVNTTHEIPAFVGGASRRQAKFETNSNHQNSKQMIKKVWVIGASEGYPPTAKSAEAAALEA